MSLIPRYRSRATTISSRHTWSYVRSARYACRTLILILDEGGSQLERSFRRYKLYELRARRSSEVAARAAVLFFIFILFISVRMKTSASQRVRIRISSWLAMSIRSECALDRVDSTLFDLASYKPTIARSEPLRFRIVDLTFGRLKRIWWTQPIEFATKGIAFGAFIRRSVIHLKIIFPCESQRSDRCIRKAAVFNQRNERRLAFRRSMSIRLIRSCRDM